MILVIQTNGKEPEPFIWIKKQTKASSYVWEKQKVSCGMKYKSSFDLIANLFRNRR